MIIFLAYEGFELIANTAHDVRDVGRTLPRAYYMAVGFVIFLYVLVALVTVGNLPVDKIVAARDYALAEAARPFLGQAGFTLIAVAAMLSTASAINATLYGAARLSYCIARDGELPAMLERKVWGEPMEGLLITAGLTLLMANAFDLTQHRDAGQRRLPADLCRREHRQRARRASYRQPRLDFGLGGRRLPDRVGCADLADNHDRARKAVGTGGDARLGAGDRGRLPAGQAGAPIA